MTQVDNLISQSVELKPEISVQIDNLMHLLIELKILESPEQSFPLSLSETENSNEPVTEEIEWLQLAPVTLEVCEAYLESDFNVIQDISNSSKINQEELENSIEIFTNFEEKLDNSEDVLQKLREILVGYELAEINNITAKIEQKLAKIENQIYDPKELINLLLPWISEILRLKITESREEIVEIIAPILDQTIRSRTEQDKISMSEAIAPVIPLAISQQIIIAPEEVSDAIAPAMGRAIKKQIEIEQNIVVDALYPIIGSTIAKYMAETIRAINRQVEETLSVEGIKRKIRAKLQGVSEAELILKEALPFTIQAIFLIHKASGLVISDIQHSDVEQLEAEMIAGMLTAIRSFANDCINQSGTMTELDAIEYGTSKIILEVAGYCYLAIVVRGEPSKNFIWKMRQFFSTVVKKYGDLIENFDGDPDLIPIEIHTLLEKLKDTDIQDKKKTKVSPLLVLSLTVISIILIPWGIWQYRSGVIHSIENQTSLALTSVPELAVYRLAVQVEHNKLKLTGRLPNQLLRQKAERIVKRTSPNWLIDNQILLVEVPADPVLAAAEVKRVTAVLNQTDNIAISAQYIAGKVAVEGTVNRIADAQIMNNAFEQIPGVKSVSSAVRVQPPQIEVRFYFQPDSASLMRADLVYKVQQVKFFLNQHPNKHLKIIGYSYDRTGVNKSQKLALARAKAVQQALIKLGIEPSRLQVISKTNLPPGIDVTHPLWLSRCVVLEAINKQF
ncbi:Outer membrane protein OmpA and related peptidoglycan-associated (plasmid) [Nostoc flagelliforme CCNUN1]|uniref:Outer membrane protein OmpA and related peptidoglycan-associated n=1 Tax=Nostoc flagelliforme CCNUN1 TaxID=2038116 RepID=A0A2K8T8R1_9NOSO|nr:OmpA family protein [Nostoc flagelliforme]AUB44040.1 Outer membrane protein OmpA and related peptidoglycan-associated [Nostoc flagelliforme CCNUN1]